jgi:dsDNA-specific endonuclease/ATPase MutS2
VPCLLPTFASASLFALTPLPLALHPKQGMALLTGPNMAGKSTILRSVCAVALLGACGLFAPAASATLPYFGEGPANYRGAQGISLLVYV